MNHRFECETCMIKAARPASKVDQGNTTSFAMIGQACQVESTLFEKMKKFFRPAP